MSNSRLTWKDKAAIATRGSQFGAIVNCALDRVIEAPRFVGKATVTSDGFVMCGFIDRNGQGHSGAFVGAYKDLQNNVNGLSKHLKLTPKQTKDFEKIIKSWIGTSYLPGGL